MTYERIKRSYSHLSSEELRKEISERSRRRYNTHKVGAADCMIDSWVLRACNEILNERSGQNAE